MADLSGLRLDLQRALDESLDWLVEVRAAGLLSSARLAEQDVATVERLRSRATSSLISIGFLGAFSSGKSFLLSGLQGLLELREVISGDTVADQYIGLLPSAPTPTNACPTTVVPVRDQYSE